MKIYRGALSQALVFFLWLVNAPVAAIAKEIGPQALIRQTADHVLSEVSKKQEELNKDSSGIYKLVQAKVIPHFDFMRMSQAAMGRYWRDTSPEQQQRLADEFRELLVRTYATALLSYSGQTIEYLPVRVAAGAEEVMIPTRIAASGGPPVPVNYRLARNSDGWQVYDVVIDGISLVTNYRSTFATEVRRFGVDGLIERLAERNAKLRG